MKWSWRRSLAWLCKTNLRQTFSKCSNHLYRLLSSAQVIIVRHNHRVFDHLILADCWRLVFFYLLLILCELFTMEVLWVFNIFSSKYWIEWPIKKGNLWQFSFSLLLVINQGMITEGGECPPISCSIQMGTAIWSTGGLSDKTTSSMWFCLTKQSFGVGRHTVMYITSGWSCNSCQHKGIIFVALNTFYFWMYIN